MMTFQGFILKGGGGGERGEEGTSEVESGEGKSEGRSEYAEEKEQVPVPTEEE